MNNRYLFMLLIISTITCYCALSISRRLSKLKINSTLFFIFFFLGFCILSLGPIFDWIIPRSYPDLFIAPKLNSILIEAGWLLFGFYSCLAVFVILADLIELITSLFWLITHLLKLDIRNSYHNYKRFYHSFSLITIALISFSTLVIGRYNAKSPIVYPIDISIANLPPSFDGYKIVQISDLHVSPMITKKNVTNVVNMSNALNPDLIVLTGDLVDGSVAARSEDIKPLEQLSALDGVYFVTGNHEYYSGVTQWLAFYPTLHFNILENEHVVIRKNRVLSDQTVEDQLIIAGVPDYSTMQHKNPTVALDSLPKIDLEKTFAGAPDNVPRILLAHSPNTYEITADSKIDLQLSGHTHAGQYFPYTFFIRYFQKYYDGLYAIEGDEHFHGQIYINKGTAFWGPPLRTWTPPEITLITLRQLKK